MRRTSTAWRCGLSRATASSQPTSPGRCASSAGLSALPGGISTMREQARAIAEVLGAAPAPGAGGVTGSTWRVADPSSGKFDSVVSAADLTNSTEDQDDGVRIARLALLNGVTQLVELVKDPEHDDWLARKRPGLPGGASGDLRLLGNYQNQAKRRVLALPKAMELITPKTFADWAPSGPQGDAGVPGVRARERRGSPGAAQRLHAEVGGERELVCGS